MGSGQEAPSSHKEVCPPLSMWQHQGHDSGAGALACFHVTSPILPCLLGMFLPPGQSSEEEAAVNKAKHVAV